MWKIIIWNNNRIPNEVWSGIDPIEGSKRYRYYRKALGLKEGSIQFICTSCL